MDRAGLPGLSLAAQLLKYTNKSKPLPEPLLNPFALEPFIPARVEAQSPTS
jgi:hypothetical protein